MSARRRFLDLKTICEIRLQAESRFQHDGFSEILNPVSWRAVGLQAESHDNIPVGRSDLAGGKRVAGRRRKYNCGDDEFRAARETPATGYF